MPGYSMAKTVAKKTMRLTPEQRGMLKKHSAHHSKKHMSMMTKMMLDGKSFDQAHKAAKAEVGD